MKNTRTALTIKQKKIIIDHHKEHPRLKQNEIANYFSQKFNVPISRRAIGDVLQNKDRIIEKYCSNSQSLQKIRQPKYLEVDKAMKIWVENIINDGFILTDNLIRLKAMDFSKKLNLEDWNPSNGWIECFKKRNDINLKILSGETGNINTSDFSVRLAEIQKIVCGYKKSDIFNMDESGLMYKEIPTKTLTNKKSKGYKKNKCRITIVFCCNADGTEKCKLLIIGKAKKPRCFKNFPVEFYCDYKNTPKAWMNNYEFNFWLEKFNIEMKAKKRNVLLILDNATSHKTLNIFSNVTICYLPPNSTGIMQPLDAGIIRSFKAKYRRLLLNQALTNYESGMGAFDSFEKINLNDAIIFSKWAWDDVSSSAISNCWKKTNILSHANTSQICLDQKDEILEIQDLIDNFKLEDKITATEYLNMDNDIEYFELTDEEIIKSLQITLENEENESETPNFNPNNTVISEESAPETKFISEIECSKSLEILKEYCLQNYLHVDTNNKKTIDESLKSIHEYIYIYVKEKEKEMFKNY